MEEVTDEEAREKPCFDQQLEERVSELKAHHEGKVLGLQRQMQELSDQLQK